jgi:hypothetical protein
MLAHVPFATFVCDSTHAWQTPLHAVLQQTPSTQLLLWQEDAVAQGAPFGCLQTPETHVPLQKLPHAPQLAVSLPRTFTSQPSVMLLLQSEYPALQM